MPRVRTAPRAARLLGVPAGVLLLLLAAPRSGWAQVEAPGSPTIRDVALSADTVGIGDRFDLRITLDLPDGAIVFTPDSLAGSGFESFEPVTWSVEEEGGVEAPSGTRTLSIVYRLIAFQLGSLAVPEFEIFTADASQAADVGLAEAEARVGSWDALVRAPSAPPSTRLLPVPEQRIWVSSVLMLDDLTTQLAPRPAADVSGGDRDWSSTFLAALFGLLFVGVLTVSTRDWLVSSRQAPAPPPPDPREDALAALDRLMEEAPHRSGDVRSFYRSWSDIIRRFVEGMSVTWGPAWTSTELMADLRQRVAILARSGEIRWEMKIAERVKFGGERPEPETAEAHWNVVRAWVERVDLEEAGRAEASPPVGHGDSR